MKKVPCDHPGCLNHVTHPCEGCGRVAGRLPTAEEIDTCPVCASRDAEPIHPFDYYKECQVCGEVWMGTHN
jgi:hypothetical protein